MALSLQTEERLDAKIKELFLASVPKYYGHTIKVVTKMKDILGPGLANFEVPLLAAYLHDIGYSARYGNIYAGEIEDQEVKIRVHSALGTDLARSILNELGVNPSVTERVAYLVSVHHREDLDDPDLKLLLQADTL